MHTPRRPQSERNNPALPNRFLQQHPNHPHPFLYTHRIKPDNTKTPKPRAGGSVYQFAAYEVRSFGCRVLKLGLGGGRSFGIWGITSEVPVAILGTVMNDVYHVGNNNDCDHRNASFHDCDARMKQRYW